MATGIIKVSKTATDITSEITWDSTITTESSKAVKVGDTIMMMFMANRTASSAKWLLATIPNDYAPPTDRWTGSCSDASGVMKFVRIENDNDVYKVYVITGNASIGYAQGSIAWPIGY